MACKIGTVVYCILQTIAFLLIIVGTPIGQFISKGSDFWSAGACLTFWGQKQGCYTTKYDVRTKNMWSSCKDRRTRFQAAQAFSIISIAIFLAAAIFGFIMLCCCRCFRWICLVLNIVGTVTACVCWACMVSEYTTNRGMLCPKLSSSMNYAAGFALFVTGWCLNLINIVFLMIPC